MPRHEDKLRDILNTILPNSVSFEVILFNEAWSIRDSKTLALKYPVSKIERKDIQNTVTRREIEYRIGRFLVKKLMGISPLDTTTTLYKKSNGAVNWPIGIIGSISHSKTTCIVTLANTSQLAGIGIDIEYGSFSSDIEKFIVNKEELLLYTGALPNPAMLRLIFCCKEALYKSLETHLKERMDFLDVNIQYLKQTGASIFEFGFQFCRQIQGLEAFNFEQFYGVAYANKEMSISIAILKHCPQKTLD